jgi:uncharacterized protein YbaR (Trm112 family)
MKEDLMDVICCPLDKHDLDLEVIRRGEDDEILEGRLVCTECGEEYPIEERADGEIVAGTLTCTACSEQYPIEDGIPNLLPPDMRDEAAA